MALATPMPRIESGASVLVGTRESAADYKLGNLSDVTALLAWLARDDNGGGPP